MLGGRLAAACSSIVATVLVVALFSGSSSGGTWPGKVAEPSGQIDIELAFDTTTSMRPSIEQAKQDGASIVGRVVEAFPETRFAVVSFRDYGNPSGDYEVLQPMTGDVAAVQAAFARLRAVRNPSPLNSPAEEYNLLFHKSYTDSAVGWRPDARKVVVVVGDAQPHGAGTSGLAGCTDASTDYYGLNTADVLAGMRVAERTLVMIRQIAKETTVSLACYQSIAERAYVGGAARDGGSADLAAPVVGLIRSAVAPVSLRPDVGVALRGGTAGYTATVSNPNGFALGLRSLSVTLPAGFRYRSGSSTGVMSADVRARTTVNWRMERALRPFEQASVYFRASAPKRRGHYTTQAVLRLQLPGGEMISSTGHTSLRVTPRLRTLVLAARATRPLKPSSALAVRGSVKIRFRAGARARAAGKLLGGRLVLRGPGRSLRLRVRSHRVVDFGSPTVLRATVSVERVRGMRACSQGARGVVTLVDDQRFQASGLRRDAIVIAFGSKCRGASGRWANSAAARSTVRTTAD